MVNIEIKEVENMLKIDANSSGKLRLKLGVLLILIIFLIFIFPSYSRSKGGKLVAFVGSASKPAMEEAARIFEKKRGIKVELNFGGSGFVLSQMELSQHGDLYIPGSPDFMIKALHKGLVYPAIAKIAYLVPALNVHRDNPKEIKSLKDLGKPGIRVAIANPDAVCVGRYAVEILEYNNLIEKIKPNIVTYTQSCAATANLLALTGDIDAVIGWRVFKYWNSKIETILLKPEQIPRLAYIPAAVSIFSDHTKEALEFIKFLKSEEGGKIFSKWGYITLMSEAKQYAPKAQTGGSYQLPAGW